MTATAERLTDEVLVPSTSQATWSFLSELSAAPASEPGEHAGSAEETPAERLVTKYPSSPTAIARLARDQLERGDIAQAVATAKQVATTGLYSDKSALVVALGVLLVAGDVADATSLLDNWADALHRIAGASLPAIATLVAANLKFRRGEVEAALEMLKAGEQPIASFAAARGSVLLSAQRYDAALHELRTAITTGPPTVPVYTNLGYLMALRGAMRKAIRATQVATHLAPGDKIANINLANFFLVRGDWQHANDVLDRLSVLHPRDYQVAACRAGAYMRAGKLPKALSTLTKALSHDVPPGPQSVPQSDLRALAEIVRRRLGRIDDQTLRHRLTNLFRATDPPSPSIALNLAFMTNDSSQLPTLRDALRRLEHLTSGETVGVEMQVAILEGRFGDASRLSRNWLSLQPFNSSAAASLTYLVGMAEGRLAEAARIGESAMHRVPREPILANNVAFAKVLLGDIGGATAALISDVATPFPTATAALIALAKGDDENSEELYRRAISLVRDDKAMVTLINTYRAIGRFWFASEPPPTFTNLPPSVTSDARISLLRYAWDTWIHGRSALG